MNLPNKLTIMRVILVPFFIFFLLCDIVPVSAIWALVVFIIASITDFLDGHIARSQNLVTNFGKFLDPLADKVLVLSALVCFSQLGLCSAVPVIIIMAREFMVSGLRLCAAGEGVVVAAGIWGKLKTAFTMVAIIAILLFAVLFGKDSSVYAAYIIIIEQLLIWISTLLTIISGGQYLVAYKDFIDPTK